MEQKKCSKCGEWKDIIEFNKDVKRKDGLTCQCKKCISEYYEKNKERIKKYRKKNKENLKNNRKIYNEKNKDKLKEYDKEYRIKNKEKLKEYREKYVKENEENIKEYGITYREKNQEHIKESHKEYYIKNAKYETYKDQLTVTEKPRLAKDGISLEVKCRYCGKYFIPNNSQVYNRLKALKYINGSENSFYCSEGCKQSCPIYNQIKYIKGTKKSTSREVQPELRQMVLKRDNYTCQKCGKTIDEIALHCHHKWPLNESPVTSADIDECITLCIDCHKKVHKEVAGCGYGEMKCSE